MHNGILHGPSVKRSKTALLALSPPQAGTRMGPLQNLIWREKDRPDGVLRL